MPVGDLFLWLTISITQNLSNLKWWSNAFKSPEKQSSFHQKHSDILSPHTGNIVSILLDTKEKSEKTRQSVYGSFHPEQQRWLKRTETSENSFGHLSVKQNSGGKNYLEDIKSEVVQKFSSGQLRMDFFGPPEFKLQIYWQVIRGFGIRQKPKQLRKLCLIYANFSAFCQRKRAQEVNVN